MAQEALKKLEEQLNCSVCLDTYFDPKQLLCNHVYCQKCLSRLAIRDQQGQLALICPMCRLVTPVPASGVASLPSAFHINHLLEIQDSFRKISEATANPLNNEAVKSTTVDIDPVAVSKHVYCSVHDNKEFELYCETCGELICTHCALRGGNHSSHDYLLLNEAFERFKCEITPSLEPMEKQLTKISKALEELDRNCVEISEQQTAIKSNIHNTITQLQEQLEVRKIELISQLDKITKRKLKSLAIQRDQIETIQAQLNSCLNFVKESLNKGCERDVLVVKTTITKQIKEITTTFKQDSLKPNTKADMTFLTANLTAICQNYGQVSALSLPYPSKCYATGNAVREALVEERSTVLLHAINFNDQPCEKTIGSLDCTLVPDLTGILERCSVGRLGLSQYEISYQCAIKGRHLLSIKVENQHISGSPFSVAVKSKVEMLGTPLLILDEVKGPWGAALNKFGELVVAECGRQCASVFSSSGMKLNSFVISGSTSADFKYPSGVAVDGDGNILLVDKSVIMLSSRGHFLKEAIDSQGKVLLGILDIAFNPTNSKFYAASESGHVEVLNSDLTYSGNCFGGGKGQLSSPWGIACDNTGKVYVADSGNHRIQVFTAEGKSLKKFGKYGRGIGELNWPAGVAIDTNGLVYVSEYHNSRISVFTSEGVIVKSFGREGRGRECLKTLLE